MRVARVCYGSYWCLADYMLRNYIQTLSKIAKTELKSILSLTHISCVFLHIFAVIQMFLLSSGVAVDKMCVSHENEIGIYILYFILFQND